jgi:hypothetical protein
VKEAKLVERSKIPPGSYKLILHGPSPAMNQQLSDIVLNPARWQDANIEMLRQTQEAIDHQHVIRDSFSDLIKEVVQGQIPVQFDAEYSKDLWDPAVILREHQGDWKGNYKDALRGIAFTEPDGGWEAARLENVSEFDIFDRLAWWNELREMS